MTPEQLAYLAGLLDSRGAISYRTVRDTTTLPQVQVNGANIELLNLFAHVTGVSVTTVTRKHNRTNCVQHCPEPHVHVTSSTGRWLVAGAKATVLLKAVLPYLHILADEAAAAVKVGETAPFKPATVKKMKELGW